ncbi:MAG: hypothetical protein J1F03_06630 [Oscillospiraceae bacterium]|nr:hypothetical protein [Oscillospiraceae bacterium]
MKKTTFQITAAAYLAVNSVFILPAVFMSFWNSITLDFPINIYFIAMVFYYVFGMTFVHLVLDAGYLVYSIRRFAKERKGLVLAVSVLVVVLSTAANVLWIMRGRPFTIQ